MTDEPETSVDKATDALANKMRACRESNRWLRIYLYDAQEELIRETGRFHMREFVIGYLTGAAVVGLCVIVHYFAH